MANGYTLAPYGVAFGDVDPSYTAADVTAAMSVIAKHFGLVRVYDSFHSVGKFKALMEAATSEGIDVLLGVPNASLPTLNAATYLTDHAYRDDGTPWPTLKCIIVGNETYRDQSTYAQCAPLLAGCVKSLIQAVAADSALRDQIAVSIDFGPALHVDPDLSKCDFTGAGTKQQPDGQYDSAYIVSAMQAILSSPLPTPKMVFGNLYPFYAPYEPHQLDLDTEPKMIHQLAGTSAGWFPYTASLKALCKHNLSGLILNCGETGWATAHADLTQTQKTSVQRLNMYLAACQQYLTDPTSFSGVVPFAGLTTVFFEMFDEPKKATPDRPWEGSWGLFEQIVPRLGRPPAVKSGLTIPFTRP